MRVARRRNEAQGHDLAVNQRIELPAQRLAAVEAARPTTIGTPRARARVATWLAALPRRQGDAPKPGPVGVEETRRRQIVARPGSRLSGRLARSPRRESAARTRSRRSGEIAGSGAKIRVVRGLVVGDLPVERRAPGLIGAGAGGDRREGRLGDRSSSSRSAIWNARISAPSGRPCGELPRAARAAAIAPLAPRFQREGSPPAARRGHNARRTGERARRQCRWTRVGREAVSRGSLARPYAETLGHRKPLATKVAQRRERLRRGIALRRGNRRRCAFAAFNPMTLTMLLALIHWPLAAVATAISRGERLGELGELD